jgi:hypothetical protein
LATEYPRLNYPRPKSTDGYLISHGGASTVTKLKKKRKKSCSKRCWVTFQQLVSSPACRVLLWEQSLESNLKLRHSWRRRRDRGIYIEKKKIINRIENIRGPRKKR